MVYKSYIRVCLGCVLRKIFAGADLDLRSAFRLRSVRDPVTVGRNTQGWKAGDEKSES